MHKSGFVSIIGRPNVGKSTLMNAFLGEDLSITNPKAQTTRHRILGILNSEDYQIVFSDTPGIIKPGYKLQEYMMSFVTSSLEDADMFLIVTEIGEDLQEADIIENIRKSSVRTVLIINKIDLSDQKSVEEKIKIYAKRFPNWEIMPVSAINGFNIQKVLNYVTDYLPEAPPYFPKDEMSDRPVRFFVSEIIREKILSLYQKEIPYSVEVEVETFKEDNKIAHIRCIIYVERETQKGILIGHKGSMLKKVGTYARLEIEKFIGKKAFLELHVKVNKNWREDDNQLRRFGYKH
ncbi:MAG: GTPase Era [Bacteroidetes bacterium]|nr:GTPase Era [Bacteroidota bacterium]